MNEKTLKEERRIKEKREKRGKESDGN